jgi:hypothetical protein
MEIIMPSTSMDCWGDKITGIILHKYRAHSIMIEFYMLIKFDLLDRCHAKGKKWQQIGAYIKEHILEFHETLTSSTNQQYFCELKII